MPYLTHFSPNCKSPFIHQVKYVYFVFSRESSPHSNLNCCSLSQLHSCCSGLSLHCHPGTFPYLFVWVPCVLDPMSCFSPSFWCSTSSASFLRRSVKEVIYFEILHVWKYLYLTSSLDWSGNLSGYIILGWNSFFLTTMNCLLASSYLNSYCWEV